MENASASALVLICRVISGVTRVDDTRGGNWGCHPSIFFWKTWRPFFSRQFCGVTPDDLFLLIALSLFIAFTRVSPPSRVSPTPFLPVRPRFSTILCKKNYFLRVSPPGGCHPGRSAPCPPSDATACDVGDTDLSKDITRWSNEMIVQEYVDSPLLIDGRYR